MNFVQKIFGTKNKRDLKRLEPLVARVNELGRSMEAKSDSELKGQTAAFRQKLAQGATLDDLLPEAFATVREVAWRVLKMKHYDVQLIGGAFLHQGKIAEMKTGEGKTLTATLAMYLNALPEKGAHLVTVNDYLARRDAEWMGRIYNYLGMGVGVILHGLEDWERQKAYQSDITYGQNNEFGFDYLRDNMKMSPGKMVQRELFYAIVDEVDSILIDEARTPLIISGPAEKSADLYQEVNKIVPRLKRDIDYTVDEKAHSVMLTESGIERLEKSLGIGNLYDPNNIEYNHHVSQALRAHTLYKRDVNYLVEDSKVIIVDEFTGRKMPGRRWSDGLHQAIEAKEGVTIEEENQTLATITFQNFFRMYKKLGGMTGTADTEAAEFHHIYKLGVSVIPTNRNIIRADASDLVYKNERGKLRAIIADIDESHHRGQPVLVGTTSVEKSEVVAKHLKQKNIPFEVLNAKQHEREAHIVAQAGRKGAITISTNMAGRGTDIVLGGNFEEMAKQQMKPEQREAAPEEYETLLAKFKEQCLAERNEVLGAGGLKIIGTERHESRRIDNQLRGRSGRQGDPGASRFYLSLEDDLLRIFGAERMTGLMERLGMEEDVPIEHRWVTKSIENAQKKVEGRNFDSRKSLLEYDDVMNQQRKAIYGLRRQVLIGAYHPMLSEDDEKAGKKPEFPTVSRDWTVDSLLAGCKEQLDGWNAICEKEEAERSKGPADAEVPEEFREPPIGRKLRGEVWRQTGCWAPELERMWERERSEIPEKIGRKIAASMIQQRERIYDLSDILIGQLVEQHCPPNVAPDEWNMTALTEAVREQFACDFTPPERGTDASGLAQAIWKAVETRLDTREKDLGRAWLLYFARHFYLEEIDQQWIEHLKMMDHLREGIYLRGYGQKDPKKEYKKEGFDLFAEMMKNIQVNTGQKVFRVEFERQNAEIPALSTKERQMTARHPSSEGSGEETSTAYGDAADGASGAVVEKKTVRRDKPKVGRNDPCPCGSGKKYKKCHGKASEDAA